jgi:hypothetical protein
MRSIRGRSSLFALIATLALAGPAWAERPSCDDLLSARAIGQSVEQVAETFKTTRVRVTACERVADHLERLAAKREQVDEERAARGIVE